MKSYYLIFLVLPLIYFGQNNFNSGFQEGYKKGYCQNQGISCLEPIPPISPIPSINENQNSYQDGYNNGFQRGLKVQESAGKPNNVERKRYQTSNSNYVDYSSDNNITNEQLAILLQAIKLKKETSRNYSEQDFYENKLVLDEIRSLLSNTKSKLDFYKKDKETILKNISKIENDINSLDNSQISSNRNYFIETKKYIWDLNTYLANALFSQGIVQYYDLLRNRNFLKLDSDLDQEIKIYDLIKSSERIAILENLRAQSKYAQKNWQEAVVSTTNAIANETTDLFNMYLIRGLSNSALQKYTVANSDYQFIIDNFFRLDRNTKDIATPYNNIGYNLIKMGSYAEARKNIDKALLFNSEAGFIWDSKGELEYKEGKFSEAIKNSTKAIDLDLNSDNSYYVRGLSYIKIGKKSDGCQDLKKAMSIGNDLANKEFIKYCK